MYYSEQLRRPRELQQQPWRRPSQLVYPLQFYHTPVYSSSQGNSARNKFTPEINNQAEICILILNLSYPTPIYSSSSGNRRCKKTAFNKLILEISLWAEMFILVLNFSYPTLDKSSSSVTGDLNGAWNKFIPEISHWAVSCQEFQQIRMVGFKLDWIILPIICGKYTKLGPIQVIIYITDRLKLFLEYSYCILGNKVHSLLFFFLLKTTTSHNDEIHYRDAKILEEMIIHFFKELGFL